MRMKVIPLTSDYEMKPFDCGDAELNGFLLHEAKAFAESRLANTFLICDDGAYQEAVPFYERNGFKRLTSTEEGDTTCGMYFDMKTLDV